MNKVLLFLLTYTEKFYTVALLYALQRINKADERALSAYNYSVDEAELLYASADRISENADAILDRANKALSAAQKTHNVQFNAVQNKLEDLRKTKV